jgi:RuvB C-terminal winged helix domain
MDRRLLRIIIEDYDGGPVGVETLAAALGEPRDTVEDVYEPYLLQQGFLGRTPRGRVANRRAYAHLGIPFTGARADAARERAQAQLFADAQTDEADPVNELAPVAPTHPKAGADVAGYRARARK